jgi:adenylate cyclase class IV
MELTRAPLAENVELKVRLDDLEIAADTCRRIGAVDHGAMEQTDTYFTVGLYRLKLRETEGGESELIGYSRPDGPDARKSQYRRQRVANPGAVKASLARQWGVKTIVRKTRRLFVWEGRVRIHLDRVHRLGEFLEFEAVVGSAKGYDEKAARHDVDRLSQEFGVTPRDLVATSYATLLKIVDGTPAGT